MILYVKRSTESIIEAEAYVRSAELIREEIMSQENKSWNPVVVNCIMSMIKCIDALMLENLGHTNKDHSTTANKLQEMYEDRLISQDYKSNINSVRKWVVDRKTEIQYRNAKVSMSDSDNALKASKRFLEKTKEELGIDK